MLLDEQRAALGKRLAALTPGDIQYSTFSPGGAEAIDVAIKLARAYTGRPGVISVHKGYHGHTGFALATGEDSFRGKFGPMMPGFTKVPFGDADALEAAISDQTAAVIMVTEWPDAARVRKLLDFANRGGNVILLLQPGLETGWAKLSGAAQQTLLELLPGEPVAALTGGAAAGSGQFVPVPPSSGEPDALVRDMLESLRREPPVIHRFVPLAQSTDPAVTTLLYLAPRFGDARSAQFGFWFRRSVGAGAVFTIASLPESRYMSPRVPWTYPMQLVKSCMRPPNRGDAQNVEIGTSISLSLNAHHVTNPAGIRLVTPKDEAYEFSPEREGGRFTLDDRTGTLSFAGTFDPGIYRWYLPGQTEPVAVANVQCPAADSEMMYREAESVLAPGPRSVIVRREGSEPYLDRLKEEMKKVSDPVHIWTWFIAVVLVLVCLEALLSSMSNLWRPLAMKWWGQKPAVAVSA
jgi:hypothetical protein